MNIRNLLPDEMVSYLKHTELPTILVEGTDDCSVYRWLEGRFLIQNLDILICNGRPALLEVYRRRAEFINRRVVFLADRDMWYFTNIPIEESRIIVFTKGYSLENDLYSRDLFEKLLEGDEKISFEKLICVLAIWFAFEVERYLKTNATLCDCHINEICPSYEICESFKRRINFIDPDPRLVDQIYSNYRFALRGKTLFQALLRILCHPARPSRYRRENLLELCAKFQLTDEIIEIIRRCTEALTIENN